MSDLIRSAGLVNYPDVARRHGLDPRRMLRDAGIALECLDDPDRMIPVQRAYRLLERSAQLSGSGSFGLEMAEANRLSTLGLLGLILREEPTFRDALNTLLRYRRVHNEGLIFSLESSTDSSPGSATALLRFELVAPVGTPLAQAHEQSLGMLLKALRALLPAAWRPRLGCLTHGPIGPRSVYQRVLDVPVQFNADFNGVVFNATDLALPLRSADAAMVRQARQQLDRLLEARGAVSCSERVGELVRVLLPAGHCDIGQVAQHLGMHRRTLHRHLLKEGSSFERVVDEVRQELAVHLVSNTSRPLGQISDLLGFSAPPAFSRWFRLVLGETARNWRLRGATGTPLSRKETGGRLH